MAHYPGLVALHGGYYYRKRVPAKLQALIGKTERKETLGADKAEALKRYPVVLRRVQVELEAARKGQPPIREAWKLRRLAEDWFEDEFPADKREYSRRMEAELFNPDHYDPRKAALVDHGMLVNPPFGTEADVNWSVGEFINRRGLKLSEEHLRAVCEEATYIHLEYYPNAFVGLAPVTLRQPIREVASGAAGLAPEPPIGPDNRPISEVLQRYFKERQPNPRSRMEWETAIRRFKEVVGGDIGVRSIRKAHVVQFKDALLDLPARTTGGTVRELIAKAKPDDAKLLPASINKQLQALSAVLGFAVRNDFADLNPVSNIRVNAGKNGRKWLPFSREEIQAIFGTDLFQKSPKKPEKRNARFWIPLFGLYHGVRITEIGDRLLSDVDVEDGIPFLKIVPENEDQSVKNEASKRKIPIHRELIRCGFLKYVAALRKRGETKLFPDIKTKSTNRNVTAAFSSWFGRYLDQVGISHRRKVFHSFRHTWEDRASNCRVEFKMAQAIVGHKIGYYGQGPSLDAMSDALKNIKYDLDLSRLYVR